MPESFSPYGQSSWGMSTDMASPANRYGPALLISSIAEEVISPEDKSEPLAKYTEAYVSDKVFHPRTIRETASSDEEDQAAPSADTASPVSSQASSFKIPRKPVLLASRTTSLKGVSDIPPSQAPSVGGPVSTMPLVFEPSQFEHLLRRHPSKDGNVIQSGVTRTRNGGFAISEGKQSGIFGGLRRVLSGLAERRAPKPEMSEEDKEKRLGEEQVKEKRREKEKEKEKRQRKLVELKRRFSDFLAAADLILSPSPSLESILSATRNSAESTTRTSPVDYNHKIAQLNKSCIGEVRGCLNALARRLVEDENLERRKGWYRVRLPSHCRQIRHLN
jgi:hypothetical protein